MPDAESKELEVQSPQSVLNPREQSAYRYFCASAQPPLAPSLQARLFELYLNGCSCEEIRRLNPDVGLGPIVHARVYGDWDRRKDEHINGLLDGVRLRVQHVSVESIDFLANMLAASHKQQGDKLKQYLQTGNEKLLGELSVKSLRQYKEVLDMLMTITGVSTTKKVKGDIHHHHHGDSPIPVAARPVDPIQAGVILEALVEDDEK